MILTDREIQSALVSGQIIISPEPKAEAFSSTTVDLTLSDTINVFRSDQDFAPTVVDPAHPGYSHTKMMESFTERKIISSDGYVLQPNQLILAWTVEDVKLPAASRLAARVEGKSSLARLGLTVHLTAPTIHAGFEGAIQLEVINLGPRSLKLRPGMRICQLIFETTLGTAEKGYRGRFFGQAG